MPSQTCYWPRARARRFTQPAAQPAPRGNDRGAAARRPAASRRQTRRKVRASAAESTLSNSGASRRSVASRLNSSACSRRSPSTSGGNASIGPCRFNSRAAPTAPMPAMPGYPSAASPTSARKSGISAGSTPNFSRTPCGVADRLGLAVDLHDAVAVDALREILVGRPDADLLHPLILRGEVRRGGQRIVRLELDHRPDGDAHRGERLLQRMKLRQQRRLDALAGLVAGPQAVAERLDDVVGRDADVRLAALDHLQHRLQHADHRAERPILALVESAQAVEVAEQLVRAVDQMNHDRVVGVSGGSRSGFHHVAHSDGQAGAATEGVATRCSAMCVAYWAASAASRSRVNAPLVDLLPRFAWSTVPLVDRNTHDGVG